MPGQIVELADCIDGLSEKQRESLTLDRKALILNHVPLDLWISESPDRGFEDVGLEDEQFDRFKDSRIQGFDDSRIRRFEDWGFGDWGFGDWGFGDWGFGDWGFGISDEGLGIRERAVPELPIRRP